MRDLNRVRSHVRLPRGWHVRYGLASLMLLALLLGGCATGSGTDWQALGLKHAGIALTLATDTGTNQTLYVGTSEGGVFHTLTNKQVGLVPSTGIPRGTTVNALVVDPQQSTHLYAGTSSGFFISTDSGASWRSEGSGLPPNDGFATLIMLGDGTLVGGSTEHGVYLSHDRGVTWTPANNGLPTQSNVYTLFWDVASKTLFAAITGDGIYASTDMGASWLSRSVGLPAHADMFAIVAAQAGSGASELLAGGMTGLYASADGGLTWRKAGSGLPTGRVLSLATDTARPGLVYAGTDSAVYRSTTGGNTWKSVGPALNHQVAVVLPVNTSAASPVVFAGAGDVVRYPPAPGTQVSAFSTVVTWIFLFVLAAAAVYFLTRLRQRRGRELASQGQRDQPDAPDHRATWQTGTREESGRRGGKWD